METVQHSTHAKRSDLETQTYSRAEVAKLVGISYTTLDELLRRGEFPIKPTRFGRQDRFPKSQVHKLLEMDDADAA